MKTCSKCNTKKELTEFHKDKRGKNGRYARCKTCHNKLAYEDRKERLATNPAFKLACNLRSRLRRDLNNKLASTTELLGCNPEHARFHIESQFTEGMTWDNIHIDHIQPCASFNLKDESEQRRCFHYTNLQPLFAEDNLRKSAKILAEHQVSLL